MDEKDLQSISKSKMAGYVKIRTHNLFLLLSMKRNKTLGELLDELAQKIEEENPPIKQWLDEK